MKSFSSSVEGDGTFWAVSERICMVLDVLRQDKKSSNKYTDFCLYNNKYLVSLQYFSSAKCFVLQRREES